MVTHAWINAKTGKFAVATAIAAATAATQALNAYAANRHAKGLADGMKPNFDAQTEELRALKEKLETAQTSLANAEAAILGQQRSIDMRNMMLSGVWFLLGIATPVVLKKFFGVG